LTENPEENEGPPPEIQFEMDFYRGVRAFVAIANVIRGAERVPVDEVVENMLAPIVGNRNKDKLMLSQVMPELYRKVVDYCSQSLVISDAIEESAE
jgi:hypothetical protein